MADDYLPGPRHVHRGRQPIYERIITNVRAHQLGRIRQEVRIRSGVVAHLASHLSSLAPRCHQPTTPADLESLDELESLIAGGQRYTSREAVGRFLAKLNGGEDYRSNQQRADRNRAAQRVEHKLAAEGF